VSTKQLSIIVGAILIGTTLGASIIASGPDYLEQRAQKERDESLICQQYRLTHDHFSTSLRTHNDPRMDAFNRSQLKELEADRVIKGCTHNDRYVD